MPETRASNKLAHPGELLAPKLRRTKGEVEAECAAKAQGKVDYEEVKKQSIICAAEFEHADRADEDFVNATPHPPFTPKPWPPVRNKKKANPIPVAETTDVKMSDDVDNASFIPPCSEKFVSEDDSAAESDNRPPPAKRPKAQTAGRATAKAGIKVTGEVGKKTKADKNDAEIVPVSDEEQSKPKKVKVKVRNEINTMARKIEDETQGTRSKYGDIVKSMPSTTQAEGRSNRKPASKAPLQAQAMRGRGLKREGVIADINTMDQVARANPDLSTNCSDLMEIDNGYILLTCILMLSLLTLDQSTLFYWTLSDTTSHKK
jgi:hypothetical protein